ncbi:similar to ALBINA 1 [Actinidia rufa]|uniref:Similar to ALBINA 1 n=1 Tax=Actinidia rufa TaxID=165716 RepID=A0A7J0HCL0_9ERIC|nr:similar to ALBINA 1 [Actinidia rufa]
MRRRVVGDVGRIMIVAITDGRANISLKRSTDPEAVPADAPRPSTQELRNEILEVAGKIYKAGMSLLVIDMENKFVSTGFAKEIARVAQGREYEKLQFATVKLKLESKFLLSLTFDAWEVHSEVEFRDLGFLSLVLRFFITVFPGTVSLEIRMEALYSKLYNKYAKLKTKQESESDKINREQEVKFTKYASAADEMVEHLRNENDRLKAEISNLRSEVASISKEWFISIAGKQLSEEIQRLKNLQGEGLFCNLREDHTKYREPNTSGSSQVESSMLNDSDVNVRRKRSRHYGTTADITGMPCTDDQLEHTPVRESNLSKQIVSSETGLVIDEPECCRRKIGLSGGGADITGPPNCMFQDLIECLVGMKLSTVAQTDGICISAVHQSSGYSFSLTRVNKVGRDEAELLYRVLSLGTFERLAPEWMREVMMFSMRMCPIFFQRLSRVIELHC